MSMLEFPTFEQMVDALSSPVVPMAGKREDDIELSTEEMIREMFTMMKNRDDIAVQGSGAGGGSGAAGISYDSSLFDYNGSLQPIPYNGGQI